MKTDKLKSLSACRDAVEWVRTQKDYKSAWQNCERGDWMLFIAFKLKVDDRKFTMAKAMIAKQVEHLMTDQRSKDAVQACIDYYNGLITREQLNAAAAAHADAYDIAKKDSLKRSADICREYLTDEVLTAYRKLKLNKENYD